MFCAFYYIVQAFHAPLLPAPKHIQYGNNTISLKNVTARLLVKQATEEDRFALRELQSILAEAGSGKSSGGSISIYLQRTGDVAPLPVPGETPGAHSREAYSIKASGNEIYIRASSSAGIFYGVQTFRQLIEHKGKEPFIPQVELQDWPSMAYRGFMMDMSHMQFPRVAEIKQQIDLLARFKANQYYFYSEGNIELQGYPLLMRDARFSQKEIKEIISYARAKHIDVVPNVELYGHLHDLFKLETYSDLSVNRYGGEFKPGDQRVQAIRNDWIAQIARLFPSPFFHMGFDETWVIDLEAKKMGMAPEQLYVDMLNQTATEVLKAGKRPIAWADMLQKYQSVIPRVIPEITACAWHYFPLEPGMYDTLLAPFTRAGLPLMVQSASVNWHWLYPAFELSFDNNNKLIAHGRRNGATGYINSAWTDDPMTLVRLTRPDMVHGSVAAWQEAPVDNSSFFSAYARLLYPPHIAGKVDSVYRLLYLAESSIRQVVGETDDALWDNPFFVPQKMLSDSSVSTLRTGRLFAENAMALIDNEMLSNADSITLFSVLTAARQLDFLAMKFLYAREIKDIYLKYQEKRDMKEFRMVTAEVTAYYHSMIVDICDAITENKKRFEKAWLNEYTDFRIGIALAKFDMELHYWMKLRTRLDAVRWSVKPDEPLPAYELLFKGD